MNTRTRTLLILSIFNACLALSVSVQAQRFISQNGRVDFFSDGLIEDISATNKKATSVFDSSTGEIVFAIPINQFQFAKSLMQEHFNDKYMESDKFPRATFQGVLRGYEASPSQQEVTAEGRLTIHGQEQTVSISGIVNRQGNNLIMTSSFPIRLEDYKVTIPRVVWQNIAEVVDVNLEFTYKPYEQ